MRSVVYVTTAFPTQTFFLENEIHRLLARGVRVRVFRLRGPGENVQPEHRVLEAITTSVGSPADLRSWLFPKLSFHSTMWLHGTLAG